MQILESTGQLTLAYMAAEFHGLTEDKERIAPLLEGLNCCAQYGGNKKTFCSLQLQSSVARTGLCFPLARALFRTCRLPRLAILLLVLLVTTCLQCIVDGDGAEEDALGNWEDDDDDLFDDDEDKEKQVEATGTEGAGWGEDEDLDLSDDDDTGPVAPQRSKEAEMMHSVPFHRLATLQLSPGASRATLQIIRRWLGRDWATAAKKSNCCH